MRFLGIMAMSAIALATFGCTARQQVDPVAGTASPDASRGLIRSHLPFDDYGLPPEQQARLEYVTHRITQLCMREAGLDVMRSLSAEVDIGVRTINEFKSRRYGISDVNISRVYGYHLSRDSRGSADPVTLNGLAAKEKAMFSKCAARAKERVQRVAGPDRQSEERIGQSSVEAFHRTRSDPRAIAVFSSWSECMSTAGHAYGDPFEAAADPRWADQGDLPSAAEIEVALDDISCKEQTGLVHVLSATEAEYQKAEIAKDRAMFDKLKKGLASRIAELSRLMQEYP